MAVSCFCMCFCLDSSCWEDMRCHFFPFFKCAWMKKVSSYILFNGRWALERKTECRVEFRKRNSGDHIIEKWGFKGLWNHLQKIKHRFKISGLDRGCIIYYCDIMAILWLFLYYSLTLLYIWLEYMIWVHDSIRRMKLSGEDICLKHLSIGYLFETLEYQEPLLLFVHVILTWH